MNPETLIALAPYVAALAISLSISAYAWRQRTIAGALPYAAVALGRSLWTFGFILEWVSITLSAKLFWDKFQWLGGMLGMVAFPAMVIEFTGMRLKRPALIWALLLIVPVSYLLLLATNDLHHLVYYDQARLIPSKPFPILDYQLTPLKKLIGAYGIVSTLFFIYLLFSRMVSGHRLYGRQVATIAIGSLVPVVGWIMILTGVQITDQRDPSPFTFAIGNLIVAYGLFRYRLFDIAPIARDRLFEDIGDFVVVIDASGRVVDVNRAGRVALNLEATDIIGRPAEVVFSAYPELMQKFGSLHQGQAEFSVRAGSQPMYFELTVTPIYSRRRRLLGRIFLAHDITRRKDLENSLRQLTEDLELRVEERTDQLAEAYDTTLRGWAKALEFRDKETEGHSRRVTEVTLKLARGLGLPEEELVHIHRGALLHDIGKMAIPDKILRKPGNLNEEEMQIVLRHPIIAYELLEPIPFLAKALEIPYCHHEKWDGTGYPRGLKEEQIPLSARIFAIADVWDALSFDRPYNKAWERERVIEHLRAEAGRHFDPKIVSLFLELVKHGGI